MGRLLSFDEFQIIARTKNPNFDNVEILSEYTKTNQPLKCKCKICGNEWTVKEAHNLYHSTISKHCDNGVLYNNFYFEKQYKTNKNIKQEIGDE